MPWASATCWPACPRCAASAGPSPAIGSCSHSLPGSPDSNDGSSDNSDGGNGKGKITLTVGTFGVFGYKQAGL
ncbi:hypothetical protein ACWEN3_46900, partial [Streptomyces sp. NPDC004561]